MVHDDKDLFLKFPNESIAREMFNDIKLAIKSGEKKSCHLSLSKDDELIDSYGLETKDREDLYSLLEATKDKDAVNYAIFDPFEGEVAHLMRGKISPDEVLMLNSKLFLSDYISASAYHSMASANKTIMNMIEAITSIKPDLDKVKPPFDLDQEYTILEMLDYRDEGKIIAVCPADRMLSPNQVQSVTRTDVLSDNFKKQLQKFYHEKKLLSPDALYNAVTKK